MTGKQSFLIHLGFYHALHDLFSLPGSHWDPCMNWSWNCWDIKPCDRLTLGISTISFWDGWHPVSQSLKALPKSGLFHPTSLSSKAFKPNHPVCVKQRILKSSFLHSFGLLNHVALGWKARRSLEKILKEWETCVSTISVSSTTSLISTTSGEI